MGKGKKSAYIKFKYDKSKHCQCGTGCSDCYGKLHCGCPECYTPRVLKRKPQLREAQIGTLSDEEEGEEGEAFPAVLELSAECTVHCGAVTTVLQLLIRTELELIKRDQRRMTTFETPSVRPRNRLSLPALTTFRLKDKSDQERRKSSVPVVLHNVSKMKQAKYYCKTCSSDICNACFSTNCSGHNVQWIGQATFVCESRYHLF